MATFFRIFKPSQSAVFRNIFAYQASQNFKLFRKSHQHNLKHTFQSRKPSSSNNQVILFGGLLSMFGYKNAKEEEPETDEDRLVHAIKLGVYAMQQGELEKSEFLLHIALKLAQDLNHDNGIYYIYTVLADLAFHQGDFMKSERLYLDVMKREISRGVPKNANSMVEISLKLAQIFAHRKEFDKAEQGFKFCIESQEEKLKAGLSNSDEAEDILGMWGMSRDLYGQFLLGQNRFAEALKQFEESYQTCCQVYGDQHPQSLVLLNSLGTVSSIIGKDDEAIMYYDKAVQVGRVIEADNLPTYLVNLGMAKIKKGLKKEAQTACKEALGLATKNKSKEEAEEAEHCLELVKKMTDLKK